MAINLLSDSMIGYWDLTPEIAQCEYQFGSQLIYVQHPKSESSELYINRAQEQVNTIWDDMDDAVNFAESCTKELLSSFWERYEQVGKTGRVLSCYSIYFCDVDSPPVYFIGRNNNFQTEYIYYAEDDWWQEAPIKMELPGLPDDLHVSIKWLGKGAFECSSFVSY